jgi:AI-2 transport protein TqsA
MKDIYARTNNVCLVFLTLVVGTAALIYMKPVLVPLIFSIFTYAVLTPFVLFVEKRAKLPKILAILMSLMILFIALSLVVLVLINSVENFVSGAPKYRESMTDFIHLVESLLFRFNIEMELGQVRDLIRSLPLFQYAQNITGQLLSFLGNLFLVFIFTVFMMSGESRIENKGPLLTEILNKMSVYISSKLFLSVMTGAFVWVTLLAFQIELAFLFAFMTILLNFIPTIGSIVAVLLPLPIVFLQYQVNWPFFVVLIVTSIIQFSIGNILEPKMLGESMDLHPITILICLIFWGMVWGVGGLFLAVPITAVIKIIFHRIEATHIIAELLAGRIPNRH